MRKTFAAININAWGVDRDTEEEDEISITLRHDDDAQVSVSLQVSRVADLLAGKDVVVNAEGESVILTFLGNLVTITAVAEDEEGVFYARFDRDFHQRMFVDALERLSD